MNHKRLPRFEDCETIERLTGGDYLAVRNLIAYTCGSCKAAIYSYP